jgi:hypothetical protein
MSTTVYRIHVSIFHTSGHEAYTTGFRSKGERDEEIRFLKREMTGMNYTITKSQAVVE